MKLDSLNRLIKNSKIIRGRWKLTDKHELSYECDDETLQKELNFRANLIAIESHALVAGITFNEDSKSVSQTVRLQGQWKVNDANQLVFEITKSNNFQAPLLFKSSWKINDAHQISYRYETRSLKTKKKQIRTLDIEGFWDISEKNRLAYLVEWDSSQALRFRGAFQTKSILAKKNEIRYQIGLETKGRRKFKTVTLFGKWKFSRRLGLSFEMDYQDRKKALLFGGDYQINNATQISIQLKNESGSSLGAELIITKEIFGDAEAFLRLQKDIRESRLEAGFIRRW